MPNESVMYVFTQSERALFAEIYFPKKVIHQGTIFRDLRRGCNADKVRRILYEKADHLLKELKVYPNIFNPYQYDEEGSARKLVNPPFPNIQEAEDRIKMYTSCFRGWAMYQVD